MSTAGRQHAGGRLGHTGRMRTSAKAALDAGWVPDVAVTALVALVSVPPLVASGTGAGIGIPCVVVAVAPLLLRRRYPLAVFVFICAVVGVSVAASPRLALQLSPVVALSAVAAHCSRRIAYTAAAVLEVGVVVSAPQLDGPWWVNSFLLSALVAAALGRGFYCGARQGYLEQLRQRAVHLERERDQQGELSAAGERARIARELHDIVAHHLTVIVALSDGAAATAAGAPQRAADTMRTVSATGRLALEETRRLLGVLRDGTELTDHQPRPGLDQIDDLVARVRDAGVPTTLTITGAPPALSESLQVTLYRIAQEALTNVLKHAGSGATASVHLDCSPAQVRLDVRDDGHRPDVEPGPLRPGRGLLGMTERVNAFGGRIRTGPAPAGGWVVSAELPVSR